MFFYTQITQLVVILQTLASLGDCTTTPAPTKYGILLFPAFELLDVTGPIDILNLLSFTIQMDLSIIAANLNPVTTKISMPSTVNSSFFETINPTHTFETAPPLDVLFIPGGPGTRGNVSAAIEFVKNRYPSLQYLVTVCTGAGIAARAGVLDGKRATTNKRAWTQTTALGPKVSWVAKARWVQDGNIWTSSGVTAGIDATLDWVEHIYGNETALFATNMLEHGRTYVSTDDPFAAVNGLSEANNTYPVL